MADLTHLSLFSGIGGLDLAAEAAGFRTVGQCEWADYPTKVLEKHWPNVARWRDIRTLTKKVFYERTELRTVDVISGGFPCQPFSSAGKRRGQEDDRYLWPEMLRVIEELRPTWVIGENVAGIVNMAIDTVLSDLEACGYATRAFVLPACGVNAPHRRDRVAIVAHANGKGLPYRQQHGAFDERPEAEPREAAQQCGQAVAHAISEEWDGTITDGYQAGQPGLADCGIDVSDTNNGSWPLRWDGELSAVESPGGGERNHEGRTPEHGGGERWAAEPGMGGGPDGLSSWMDSVRAGWAGGTWEAGIPRLATGVPNRVGRLKALGNAVVPQQFYPVFRAIAEIESGEANEV